MVGSCEASLVGPVLLVNDTVLSGFSNTDARACVSKELARV